MIPDVIENTGLWKRTLSPSINDGLAAQREKLRVTLSQMRDRVAHLLKEIPADCRDLTIHDISHFDALWEMADLVAGKEYDLTPSEAFVFGASVLLHDAGLTAASYKGGLDALRDSLEWKDTEALFRMQRELSDHEPLSSEGEKTITFQVLRSLHAAQAERLATHAWTVKGSPNTLSLIDDLELRQAFGRSIGKIAHSHHWSIDKVADEMRQNLGPSPELPATWTLSEIKVACLLRCADIVHIDRRRAPTILLAAKALGEISERHWTFQNRLNRPALRDGSLTYNSGDDFKIDDAEAWWLNYEVIRDIDKEIRGANSLLSEKREPQFDAQRVSGAESPRALSKYITTDGWKPVNTEVRVSDPTRLALSLGGKNLYGDDKLAPLRELLQNAVDAVRARRCLEERPRNWGKIVVTVECGDCGTNWLRVDDNGTGMSERVLTGSLLDFGRSFWSSDTMKSEFPGLASKSLSPIGKFGIGFFSIFLLGTKVLISSRNFRKNESAKTLVFNDITRRPLLRDCESGELPLDTSTRVSVQLNSLDFWNAPIYLRDGVMNNRREIAPKQAVHRMISAVDVEILFQDRVGGDSFEHKPNWDDGDAAVFLRDLYAEQPQNYFLDRVIEAHGDRLRLIHSSSGEVIGRAALNIAPTIFGRRDSAFSRISVGGFVTKQVENPSSLDSFYIGVLPGQTEVASRATAFTSVEKNSLATWASEQARILDQKKIHPHDLLEVCHSIFRLGGDPLSLPFCLAESRNFNLSELRLYLKERRRISLPVSVSRRPSNYNSDGEYEMKYLTFDAIARQVVFYGLADGVIVLNSSESHVMKNLPEDDAFVSQLESGSEISINSGDLNEGEQCVILSLLDILNKEWGASPTITVVPGQYLEVEPYRGKEASWLLHFARI